MNYEWELHAVVPHGRGERLAAAARKAGARGGTILVGRGEHSSPVLRFLELAEYEKKFKIPGIKEAVAFSIENSPELALRLNNNQLPFGCHNWYNGMFINFWKKYIKIK